MCSPVGWFILYWNWDPFAGKKEGSDANVPRALVHKELILARSLCSGLVLLVQSEGVRFLSALPAGASRLLLLSQEVNQEKGFLILTEPLITQWCTSDIIIV